ncbi:MAG TPA: hypothetical protein VHE61_21395, partial [Opitutaceae bacterium]|nr:hypothetical protein [Opitutaceae bacterium]
MISPLLITSALAFGAVIFCLLPSGVTTMGDDFAFYRSIAETIQHHRPWTDDYLEPWAATLSVLSAGIFLITHSFIAATHGLVVVLATLSFGGCSALLMRRGLSRIAAVAIATAILSSPLLLQYTVEFTSWIVYVPCLLWALSAAEKKSWGCFTIAWIAALATRQTAVVWGVLPAAEAWMAWRKRIEPPASATWRAPLVAVLVGVVASAVLFFGMNRTAAYLHLTEAQLGEAGKQIFHWRHDAGLVSRFATGLCVFALATGFGTWLLNPEPPPRPWPRFSRFAIGVVLVTALPGLSRFINFTDFGYKGPWVSAYYLLLAVLGAVGWTIRPKFTVVWPIALTAVAGMALMSLHTPLNAAYLLEPALLGLFAGAPANRPEISVTSSRSGTLLRGFRLAALGGLLFWHLVWAFDLKSTADRHFARIRVTELALRKGQIALGDTPPGVESLIYWHALPYLAAHPRSHLIIRTLLPRLRTPNLAVKFIQSFPAPLRWWPGFADTPAPTNSDVLQHEAF